MDNIENMYKEIVFMEYDIINENLFSAEKKDLKRKILILKDTIRSSIFTEFNRILNNEKIEHRFDLMCELLHYSKYADI
jgi:hypothetical protein